MTNHTSHTRIEVDEALLDRLVKAQAAHTAAMLTDPYNRFGDDSGDYTNAALEAMRTLFELYWDQVDLEGLDAYLNTPEDEADERGEIVCGSIGRVTHLGMLACDGVCNELWELNCPALPKED